jgi:hypothetical protein
MPGSSKDADGISPEVELYVADINRAISDALGIPPD